MTGIGAKSGAFAAGAQTPGRIAARAIRSMRRPTELAGLGGLLVLYGFVYVLGVAELYPAMNIAGPVVLCTVLGWSAYRIVERNPIAVWAPLFWFRVACAVYFGFGALVPHIVNEETLQRIYALHYFDDALNLKVNLVYCLGIFCTLVFSFLFLGLNRGGAQRAGAGDAQPGIDRTLFFALVFLLVGGGLRYGVTIPHGFGLTSYTLPGAISTLGNMYYVGIYLLIFHALGSNRRVLLIAIALVVIEILVSVASFAKMNLMLILIFSFLGFISRDVTRGKVLAGAAFVLFSYFAFQPLVEYGRTETALRYGAISGAGLVERMDIVQGYFGSGNSRAAASSQDGLIRLSYVSVAAFAIDRYDAGVKLDTLGNAAAVLVPRLLWPGKPIITRLGSDFHFMVFRQVGSALGIGHFAEAYGNFGWIGIAPFMAVLALILSVFSRVSVAIVARKDWLFLPVVFLGVNMGFRVDGHFVPDILGTAWMAAVFGAGLWVARHLVLSSARRRTAPRRHLMTTGSRRA